MARELCEEKSREIVSSEGFCYSDISSSSPIIHQNHTVNQIQGFEGNPAEIFNLTTGVEMIGFSKHLQLQQAAAAADSNSVVWRGFFKGDNPGPSSSKTMNESTASDHCYQHHEFNKQDFSTGMSESSGDRNLIVGHDHHHHHHHDMRFISSSSSRDEFFGKPAASSSIQQMIQDGFLGKAIPNIHHHQQEQLQLRDSEYLGPAQELLNEFCSLGTKQTDATKHKRSHKAKQQWDDENASGSSRNINQYLFYLEFMELQKRKTNLLQMLAEVDRRYKLYCDQMKVVVSSFEAVAGTGAARAYSAVASEAMSIHFRCLRDGIVGHIQATNKAMGEKDPVAPGTSRGGTPRLKIIDQALRQQRAFQQTSMTETHPWRPQRGLPARSVSLLRAWLFEHFLHPYPSDVDKHILARQTGLSRSQVSNWFINARVRLWKPMVEEMYLDETKEHDNNAASNSNGVTDLDDSGVPVRPHVQHQHQDPPAPADQKPTQDQLVRIDSECLSTSADKNDHVHKATPNINNKALQSHRQRHQEFGSFGNAMQLDFSSYNQQHTVGGGGVSYANHQNAHHQNFHGDGGVSLTLGLQQHGGSGVSLAFSPASQSSLFYPTRSDHHMDQDCQQVHYSLLDGDQGQHLPYRNLMGAQLRHDLAGWFIN